MESLIYSDNTGQSPDPPPVCPFYNAVSDASDIEVKTMTYSASFVIHADNGPRCLRMILLRLLVLVSRVLLGRCRRWM